MEARQQVGRHGHQLEAEEQGDEVRAAGEHEDAEGREEEDRVELAERQSADDEVAGREQGRQQTDADGRAKRLAAIGENLDRYWEKAKALQATKKTGDVPLAEFSAKATLMQAVYLGLARPDSDAETVTLLVDFEKRYPEQKDLFPQAVRLRLVALRNLRRWPEAESR